jgi:hypothetical protein
LTLSDVLNSLNLKTYIPILTDNGVSEVEDLKYLRDADYDLLIPTLLPRRKLQRWIEDNLK